MIVGYKGDSVERNFGIAYENHQPKFAISLPGGGGSDGGQPSQPCTERGWRFYDGFDFVENNLSNVSAGLLIFYQNHQFKTK